METKKSVKILFIAEPDKIAGKVVDFVEDSWQSHVAFVINNTMYEAVMPVLTNENSVDKYKYHYVEEIEVDVPHIHNAISKANSLIGTPYGLFTSCVMGGIHEVFDISIGTNSSLSIDCSEYATIVLREGGVPVLPELLAGSITPKNLYDFLKKDTI